MQPRTVPLQGLLIAGEIILILVTAGLLLRIQIQEEEAPHSIPGLNHTLGVVLVQVHQALTVLHEEEVPQGVVIKVAVLPPADLQGLHIQAVAGEEVLQGLAVAREVAVVEGVKV